MSVRFDKSIDAYYNNVYSQSVTESSLVSLFEVFGEILNKMSEKGGAKDPSVRLWSQSVIEAS